MSRRSPGALHGIEVIGGFKLTGTLLEGKSMPQMNALAALAESGRFATVAMAMAMAKAMAGLVA